MQKNFSVKFVFLSGCLLGSLLFMSLYGLKVLNPGYVDWLKNSGDLSVHYMGWLCYRHSEWNFPIGLFSGINEQLTSIIMMDAIPHFAFFFKILSPLLPETFQYFGFFGIFSFALMGGFSSILLFRVSNNLWLSLIFSTVFIFSPYVMQRMFGHTSLGSQWIIAAALYLWIWKPGRGKKRNILFWCLLMIAASGTHLYFIPILMVLLFCCTIQDLLEKESMRALLIRLCLTPLAALLTLLFYGVFSTPIHRGGDQHGYFIANLNSLINHQGYGVFLRSLPLSPHGGQYEGFGYLGFGIIIGIIIVFAFFYICKRGKEERLFSKPLSVSILLCLVISLIIATGFSFWWCDQNISTPKIPYFLMRLFTFFRSAGRFIWIADYLIFFVVFVGIYRMYQLKKINISLLVVTLVFLQLADFSVRMLKIHKDKKYSTYIDLSSNYNKKAWDAVFAEQKHLKYIRNVDFKEIEKHQIIDIRAAELGVSVNQAASSNIDIPSLQKTTDQTIQELKKGVVRADTVYVFSSNDATLANYPLHYYVIDKWILGMKNSMSGLTSIQGVSEFTPQGLSVPNVQKP